MLSESHLYWCWVESLINGGRTAAWLNTLLQDRTPSLRLLSQTPLASNFTLFSSPLGQSHQTWGAQFPKFYTVICLQLALVEGKCQPCTIFTPNILQCWQKCLPYLALQTPYGNFHLLLNPLQQCMGSNRPFQVLIWVWMNLFAVSNIPTPHQSLRLFSLLRYGSFSREAGYHPAVLERNRNRCSSFVLWSTWRKLQFHLKLVAKKSQIPFCLFTLEGAWELSAALYTSLCFQSLCIHQQY